VANGDDIDEGKIDSDSLVAHVMQAKSNSSLLLLLGCYLGSALTFAVFQQANAQELPANLPSVNLPTGAVPTEPLPASEQTLAIAPLPAVGQWSCNLEIPLTAIKPHRSPPVVTALAASRDGRFLAAAGDDHVIRLIDLDSRNIISELAGHRDWIQTLVFSTDSKQLFSSGNDGRVLRWVYGQPNGPDEILHLPYAVRCLSLSTQKQLLAVGGFGTEVGLWDLKAAKWHLKFSCACGDQRCVRFSPEGDKLLCGGRDGQLRVWDTATGTEVAHVQLHHDRVHTAAFSVNGQSITSVGDDRRIVRYDLISKEVTLDRELKGAKLRSLCLINDYLIAAAGADNSIHIYDVIADEEISKLTGHTGSVAVMCSCADQLASGSFDTTVRLWKIEASLSQGPGITKSVGLAPLEVDRNMEIR
jgi:WD40 repeat protein